MRLSDSIIRYHFFGWMFTFVGIFGIIDSLFIGLKPLTYTFVFMLSLVLIMFGWIFDTLFYLLEMMN